MRPSAPGSYTNAAGQIIYADGVVQNWVGGNGRVDATFIGRNGNKIELPGVYVTVLNTMEGRGAAFPGGGYAVIHLDPTGNGIQDLEHEYGHYLDYLSRGGLYYNFVVVPLSVLTPQLRVLINIIGLKYGLIN